MAEEPLIKAGRGVAVGVIDSPGVDGESQPRVRVPRGGIAPPRAARWVVLFAQGDLSHSTSGTTTETSPTTLSKTG